MGWFPSAFGSKTVSEREMERYLASLAPDALAGKTALVTGGSSGIGFEVSKTLAAKGASVFIAARNKQKAIAATIAIRQLVPTADVNVIRLDLADLDETKRSALMIAQNIGKIDILVANAGVFSLDSASFSADGYESHFQTNHLGHFMLVRGLMPVILKAHAPRIVVISSALQRKCVSSGIDYDSLTTKKNYSGVYLYGQSNLANALFATELNERYSDKVFVNSVHPGGVATSIFRPRRFTFLWLLSPLVNLYFWLNWLTPKQGSLSTLFAALSPDVEEKKIKGKYIVPFGVVSNAHHPLALDTGASKKLWEYSEDICSKF
ncbi:hypothetical protein HK100_006847 [Physocladia obscura]|uniref:Uncharacterized protein n=1 Tax=Physocladia obscura TaxID=109957 RepID=A0AAD5XBG8_9FUNG|nr:hypothetical protein HK100_006847 [Physocladia obscura]